jgi:aminoglycoside 2''-phosphotransferase
MAVVPGRSSRPWFADQHQTVMEKLEQYTQIIKRNYPELEVISARFNQDGQYNDVVIINDSQVFRFARVPEAVKTLRQEVAVQKSLQGRLPLRIPEPVYVQVENENLGEAFMGYPMISGEPLWRERFQSIASQDVRKRMAIQLAEFLRKLHQFNVAEIPTPLRRYETRDEWVDLYSRIQNHLFPHIREDARRDVKQHFNHYLSQPDRYRFTSCLRHGDFGTGNIIYDPESLWITGIVDFGGIGLGDPAVDFAGLYISYGKAFYEDCCTEYPQMHAALERVHFYCGTFALQEALFGVENEDETAFHAGIKDYL